MHSALSEGFINKSSKRMVQKMGAKNDEEDFNKGAYQTDQSQTGQGKDIHFQGTTGNGFADKIFPGKEKVY